MNCVNGEQTEWSPEEGYILSAPADNLEEAKDVTRQLTKDYYNLID